MKKFLSILLAVCLVLALLPAKGNAAFSNDYPNTWRNTGDQAVDIARIAESQLGYRATGEHTKYNNWYYGYDMGAPWCAIFISWCANQARIPTSTINKNAKASGYSISRMSDNLFGVPAYSFSSTQAKTGDIVYIDNTNNGVSDHVGLVYKVDQTCIYTIEGNYSNKVSECKYLKSTGYQKSDSGISKKVHIIFYGRPRYGISNNIVSPTLATISGQNVPTSLTKGNTYSIRGTISSSTKITSVTAGIYTSSSGTNMVYEKTVQPDTTSYRLTNVDRYLYFNKLNAGTYYYIVKATNSAGTKTLINQKFTVSNPAAPKYATISGHNAPTSLTKGKTYSIKGTISSSTKITSVSVGVYTAQSGGTRKTGASATPNSTSYNLANLDRYVYFNTLSAGTYYYRVTAKNSAGTATLINQKFTVSSPAPVAPSYAAISGANAPSSLGIGKTYSIRGTISSGTKITSVTAGIYTSSSGTNMVYGKTVQPNTTSYSLTNVDRYLYFNKLSAGTYYYIVKATNSAGTKTLINQRFTVSKSIPSAWGTLTPKCAPGARLDVTSSGTGDGVNVQIWDANSTLAQYWRLVDLGNGYYAIQSAVSGKYLDVAGGKTASGTNVQQYTWNATNAQQWKLIDAGGGYYYICPRLNLNLCLDVHGGGSASGTNVWVHARNNTQAQMWKFN